MVAPIVFFDIAGEDSQRLMKFYSELFGWEVSANGEFNIPVVTPIPGAIRKDSSEKRIYIGVEDIAEKLAEIDAKGAPLIRNDSKFLAWLYSGCLKTLKEIPWGW